MNLKNMHVKRKGEGMFYKDALKMLCGYIDQNEITNHSSVEKLEKFITEKKNEIPEKEFFYIAGAIAQMVYGNGDLYERAASDELYRYEKLIGLE
jgi:hypothetical protein